MYERSENYGLCIRPGCMLNSARCNTGFCILCCKTYHLSWAGHTMAGGHRTPPDESRLPAHYQQVPATLAPVDPTPGEVTEATDTIFPLDSSVRGYRPLNAATPEELRDA